MPQRPTTELMPAGDFNKLFVLALTDQAFQQELMKDGFAALERRGMKVAVPREVQAALKKAITPARAKPRCGVCGVCGLCALCGEINAGSASAALWALFHLA
ncbi:MAG: hypothetical protein HY822_20380 [Acidobacteria bacterium]|nr:hypothetical protein [Acidobacteriota bacterium]